MGLKFFPGDDAESGTGRVLNFQFSGGRHIGRPLAEEDPTRAAELAAHREALRKMVADHVAAFATFQPINTREELEQFFNAVNRYVVPLAHSDSLFRNHAQEIMTGVIEGMKNAERAKYRVYVKRTLDCRMDIPGSLFVLQTHEGLRALAELFFQKTGMDVWLLFLQQFEEGRLKMLYRLKSMQNCDQDGWELRLKQKPSDIITKLTVRPRHQAWSGIPPLACFVLLPEPREEDGEDDPDGPMRA